MGRGRTKAAQTRHRPRWHSTRVRESFPFPGAPVEGDVLGGCSLGDEFQRRMQVEVRDARVMRAAHPAFHPAPPPAPRRRGPREDVIWKACVVATVDLVRALRGVSTIDDDDLVAVTCALVFYGWGPREWGTPFGSTDECFTADPFRTQRAEAELDAFRERVRDTYRRAQRIKPARKELNPRLTAR